MSNTTTDTSDSAKQTSCRSGEDLRTTLARDGFVKISNAISADELQRYRSAAIELTALARNGKWPFLRTLPKQFPPWNVADLGHGIWGVQHLLHPNIPAHLRQTFAQSYFHPALMATVMEILQCAEMDLVLELYNMLVRPDHDFSLRWHRDVISPSASAEEEAACLAELMVHAQWNLALYEDRSLVVVPGSHSRARTQAEREANPYEPALPGQHVVQLNAGDILFYNNNILHRGVYDSHGTERMTLHGTMGLARADLQRARNILQHGIGTWVAQSDFTCLPDQRMRDTAVRMQRRLMDMGRGEDLGYAPDD